jgi:predicted ester cyclase
VSPETEATSSTEKIARAYFGRVTARDPDGMMEFWEPGGIGHLYGIVELRAPDTYREWFSNLFAAFPDLRFEVLEITAEDDRAAVQWRATGSFTGETSFEGMLPTGAEVELRGCDVLTIRDGKLASLHAYTNSVDLARQVGALPPQGSAAERSMNALLNLKTRAVRAIAKRRS